MKITKNVVEKKELVPIITKETRYIMDLDFQEVLFLRDVCDCIGGDPSKSRRAISDKLVKALQSAGVRGVSFGEKKDIVRDGSIYFKNTEDDA